MRFSSRRWRRAEDPDDKSVPPRVTFGLLSIIIKLKTWDFKSVLLFKFEIGRLIWHHLYSNISNTWCEVYSSLPMNLKMFHGKILKSSFFHLIKNLSAIIKFEKNPENQPNWKTLLDHPMLRPCDFSNPDKMTYSDLGTKFDFMLTWITLILTVQIRYLSDAMFAVCYGINKMIHFTDRQTY